MVFSMFLRTAYMLLCVQTQIIQIMLSCSNFNTVVRTQRRNPVSFEEIIQVLHALLV